MPIITKISVQQKKIDRYNIFLDGKYAFSVDEDVLIKHQLKKGMELDEFSLSEIGYQDEIRKAYNIAIQYLSKRMRSEKEIRQSLAAKEIDEVIIQEVVLKLFEFNFLNDEEYAVAFVRTLMNTTDKGKEVVKQELWEKGISENLIEQALQEYPYEDEFNKALTLSEKFVKKNTSDSSKIVKQKLEQLLMRKGYSRGTIKEAIAETEIEKTVDEEFEAIRKHAEKAHRKYSSFTGYEYEQKMKQALYRKGFSIELIEQMINDYREQ